MNNKIYISYADDDFIARDGIIEKYRKDSIFEPCIDSGDGALIHRCKGILVLLGKNSYNSDRMQHEYVKAKSASIPVLAIKIFSDFNSPVPTWLDEEVQPFDWQTINDFIN